MGKLVGYDYEITYKPSKTNSAADALSRVHGSPTLDAIFIPQATIWDDIRALNATDTYLQCVGETRQLKPRKAILMEKWPCLLS